ncbi:hypothetical protein SAMN05660971_03727 [Halomonas cupida]|uniref:Uncharacterized protein n=1 Tax=Halomonas cupida TaxID=44933 RepID=A0A1M7L7C6_9GAMM|nr:hypothetical protein SAMN05660971_03727 [Halomonas cupida]
MSAQSQFHFIRSNVWNILMEGGMLIMSTLFKELKRLKTAATSMSPWKSVGLCWKV